MTGIDKFCAYVNLNIGKPLTTGVIAEKGRIHRRRVQMFCKAIKGSRKVSTGKLQGRSIVYTFKKVISAKDLAAKTV